MNRFRVSRGREEEFVEIWRNRDSYLDDVEGIKDFQLLRGEAEEDATTAKGEDELRQSVFSSLGKAVQKSVRSTVLGE